MNDANGNPKYSGDSTPIAFDAAQSQVAIETKTTIEFDAAGPQHHTGSGWIMGMYPILTRKGDIEPVYRVQLYMLDGEVVPQDPPKTIILGEPEITKVFPTESSAT